MYSVRKRFGGLYWRLSSSYFAVTLLAAVIVEIAVTLSSTIQGSQPVRATPQGSVAIPSSHAPSGFSLFLGAFWNHLQGGGLYFILIASVVGTLTGLLITRNVTRRLRRITLAAQAWSKGEFGVEAHDSTPDEIGQLGQDLNGMAQQLHALLATREELATIEERNRLARDLHDFVKQNIFATALLVGAARTHLPPDMLPAQTYLADAEALAEETRQELTALVRALRPARLDDKGLAVVLRDAAEQWSRRMGVAVAMRTQGERVIALDIEEALFRVAQEALANIGRHSEAAHVTIQLAWESAQVRLTITDDGAGFDVAHANGRGVGLASMRERVVAHNGTLKITSTAGATTVVAAIPLSVAPQSAQKVTR
ncbi:MAG TPA: sensor histidine kinase [Ktedonobacterales bacterium]|nr:sensor histidine kinase [Ktedonobacterales bacterium]